MDCLNLSAKAKSVAFTEEGLERAKTFLEKLLGTMPNNPQSGRDANGLSCFGAASRVRRLLREAFGTPIYAFNFDFP